MLFEDAVNRLARRDVALERDEIFPYNALQTHPASMRQFVIAMTDDDPFILPKWNDFEVRFAQRQGDDSEIDQIIQTGIVDFVCPAVFDMDIDLWMRFDEPFDEGRQFMQPHAVDRCDADRPRDHLCFRPEPHLERLKTFGDLLAYFVQQPPGLGRDDAFSLSAIDQLLVESLFQCFDLLADRRLRDKIERSRLRKRSEERRVGKE